MTKEPTMPHAIRRGFTLIELVVVLAVILVLVSLVLGVSAVLIRRSEVRQTEGALEILTAAMDEFDQSRGRPLTFGARNQPAGAKYEIPLLALNYPHVILFVLDRLATHGPSREMLSKIDGSLLRNTTTNVPTTPSGYPANEFWWGPLPRMELVDPWDTRISVIFAGRPWVEGDDPNLKDLDGTIRTGDEVLFGSCVNRRTRLVSSGPDRKLGTDDDVANYVERPQ
ncbi:MAG: prepilin-type N-terminal cleavage/methylation domain-containing protein [Phycisphaerae bacterium]|nr:prepilin-type N-terminal cleavage/methylation domain-containing protein [Phycisphaerae bacterium]